MEDEIGGADSPATPAGGRTHAIASDSSERRPRFPHYVPHAFHSAKPPPQSPLPKCLHESAPCAGLRKVAIWTEKETSRLLGVFDTLGNFQRSVLHAYRRSEDVCQALFKYISRFSTVQFLHSNTLQIRIHLVVPICRSKASSY